MINLKKPISVYPLFLFAMAILIQGSLVWAADYTLPPLKITPLPRPTPRFEVQRFKITGNTILPEAELRKITDAYQKRPITLSDLEQLRHQLNRCYYQHGYVNSGVVFSQAFDSPDEPTLKVIQGRVIRMDVKGLKHLSANYIKKRLELGVGPPLNMNTLRERIRILHENPLIRRIRAEISPSGRLGEAILKVNVEETRPYYMGARFDNDHSPSTGAEQLTLYAFHNNATGWGDALAAQFSLTTGAKEISADYDIPLSARELMLNLKFETVSSEVVEKPFDELDIKSEAVDFGIGVSRPFGRAPERTIVLGLMAEKRHLETSLLGRGFSFSPGVQRGEADITVLRFSQQWLQKELNQVLAVNSVFSMGLNVLNATQNESAPDGDFFVWMGQAQWIRRLPDLWQSQLVLRTEVQLAVDPLLPMEKFGVGGAGAGGVRGYRKNQLVKDNGVAASAELRIPLIRLPLPLVAKDASDGMVRAVPFFDFGWARDKEPNDQDPDTISSLGLGLRWDISPRAHAHIYYGHGFETFENISRNWQDEGIHFEIRWDFF